MPPKGRRQRENAAEDEHRFALDDLQDAVDKFGKDGGPESENLRRALDREKAAHDEVQARRGRKGNANGGKKG